jgi:hypothetical protein
MVTTLVGDFTLAANAATTFDASQYQSLWVMISSAAPSNIDGPNAVQVSFTMTNTGPFAGFAVASWLLGLPFCQANVMVPVLGPLCTIQNFDPTYAVTVEVWGSNRPAPIRDNVYYYNGHGLFRYGLNITAPTASNDLGTPAFGAFPQGMCNITARLTFTNTATNPQFTIGARVHGPPGGSSNVVALINADQFVNNAGDSKTWNATTRVIMPPGISNLNISLASFPAGNLNVIMTGASL